jgi:ligand-binding sensor domain-containing protein
MKKLYKVTFTVLFLLSCFNGLFAQEEYPIREFTIKDGLPSMQVSFIYKDKLGHIWLATQNGISKYDGKKFINYKTIPNVFSGVFHYITGDNTGNLYCSTEQNTSKFDGKNFIKLKNSEYLYNSITVDNNNNFYASRKLKVYINNKNDSLEVLNWPSMKNLEVRFFKFNKSNNTFIALANNIGIIEINPKGYKILIPETKFSIVFYHEINNNLILTLNNQNTIKYFLFEKNKITNFLNYDLITDKIISIKAVGYDVPILLKELFLLPYNEPKLHKINVKNIHFPSFLNTKNGIYINSNNGFYFISTNGIKSISSKIIPNCNAILEDNEGKKWFWSNGNYTKILYKNKIVNFTNDDIAFKKSVKTDFKNVPLQPTNLWWWMNVIKDIEKPSY